MYVIGFIMSDTASGGKQVSEEVERALAKLGPARINGRSEISLILTKCQSAYCK